MRKRRARLCRTNQRSGSGRNYAIRPVRWAIRSVSREDEASGKESSGAPSCHSSQKKRSREPARSLPKGTRFWLGRGFRWLDKMHPPVEPEEAFHLRRLQVTLSAAKLGARVGAAYEKTRRGGSLPLHESTRRSWNLGTGAGRCWRKCAKSYTRQTLRSSKSGSGWGLPSGLTAASSAPERRTRASSR